MVRLKVKERVTGVSQEQGIGFLRVKAGLLAEYNANLAYILLRWGELTSMRRDGQQFGWA